MGEVMRKAVLLASILALSGCKSGHDEQSSVGLTAFPADGREGAALYFFSKGCPITGGPAALEEEALLPLIVGAAAPFVAEFTVGLVGALIEAQKEGLNGSFPATGLTPALHNPDGTLSFNCIAIARGLFGAVSAQREDGGDGVFLRAHLEPLGLRDYPAFYMEAGATLEQKALVLTPQYLRYAGTSARRPGSDRKHVGMVLALLEKSVKPGEETTDDQSVALYRFNFGRLEIGRSYAASLLIGTSALQTLPEKSEDNPTPVNAFALVTESEDPGVLLKVLSESFDARKDDLKTALTGIIKEALVPEEGRE
jgi:hypothetical protein